MLIGIHRDFGYNNNKFADVYAEILKINNIPYIFLDINDQEGFWRDVERLTHFIFRWGQYDDEKNLANSLMPVLFAKRNLKCLPDFNTSWHYDNKIAQMYLLKANGFPVIDTNVIWEIEKAKTFFSQSKYPLVIKLSGGAGSSNVKLLDNENAARRLLKRLFTRGYSSLEFQHSLNHFNYKYVKEKLYSIFFGREGYWQINKNYILVQQFLPNNKFDIRIVTIGNRAIGFIRYNRQSDFRASGSGNFNLDPGLVDKRCLKIAFEVSAKLKFQTMAYDFLVDEFGEPRICEISYTFSFGKPYTDCPGFWDENLKWHDGKNWLEFYQLIDFLGIPGLKRLEI